MVDGVLIWPSVWYPPLWILSSAAHRGQVPWWDLQRSFVADWVEQGMFWRALVISWFMLISVIDGWLQDGYTCSWRTFESVPWGVGETFQRGSWPRWWDLMDNLFLWTFALIYSLYFQTWAVRFDVPCFHCRSNLVLYLWRWLIPRHYSLVGYSRLVMFSFGFQQAYQRGFEDGDRLFFVNVCASSRAVIVQDLVDYDYGISAWRLLSLLSRTWSTGWHQVVICATPPMVHFSFWTLA